MMKHEARKEKGFVFLRKHKKIVGTETTLFFILFSYDFHFLMENQSLSFEKIFEIRKTNMK